MKVIDWRDNARQVAENYRKAYVRYPPDHRFPSGYTIAETQAFLDALDPETASVADYGHMQSWVEQSCDECGLNFDTLIRIGDEPDYEMRWQDLCAGCLQAAVKLAVNP